VRSGRISYWSNGRILLKVKESPPSKNKKQLLIMDESLTADEASSEDNGQLRRSSPRGGPAAGGEGGSNGRTDGDSLEVSRQKEKLQKGHPTRSTRVLLMVAGFLGIQREFFIPPPTLPIGDHALGMKFSVMNWRPFNSFFIVRISRESHDLFKEDHDFLLSHQPPPLFPLFFVLSTMVVAMLVNQVPPLTINLAPLFSK